MSGCYFRQTRLCPHCGKSYWRIFGYCNVCWELDDFNDDQSVSHFKEQKGKMWSRKLHRYLTEKEIKSGMKGN